MRADAQRNRDRIVEVARDVFREQGYDASLDLVAKRAGVGAGTLYRHFPRRDDLVDAVLAPWMETVDAAAEKALLHEGDARDRLLAWFDEYVRLISAHKGTPAKITCNMGDPDSPIRSKCEVLRSASEKVLDRLHAEDALRADVDALQVARLVGGVATVSDDGGLDETSVRAMLAVVADGLLR